MAKPGYIYDFERLIQGMNMKYDQRDMYHTNNVAKDGGWKHEWNQKIYDSLCRECQEFEEDKVLIAYRFENSVPKCLWKSRGICEYMNVTPFVSSVMINISPDWDGKCPKTGKQIDRRSNSCKIEILKNIVEGYLREGQRYGKASYIIENGSEGDHIHAHIVAEFNPMIQKSVNTHLTKGVHSSQLIKRANKLKGMGGMLKGVGIQKVFLRTEKLVEDKLDYLIEEKKPDGHKNKSKLMERVDLVF